jgi:predicted dehydrogenase
MIRIGVIGYGYWGPNLARNIAETPGATLAAVSDLDEGRLFAARGRHGGVRTTPRTDDLLDDRAVDAVAIATPVATLAVHDLAILDYVLPAEPIVAVSATGMSIDGGALPDLVSLNLFFERSRLIARLHANWLSRQGAADAHRRRCRHGAVRRPRFR